MVCAERTDRFFLEWYATNARAMVTMRLTPFTPINAPLHAKNGMTLTSSDVPCIEDSIPIQGGIEVCTSSTYR